MGLFAPLESSMFMQRNRLFPVLVFILALFSACSTEQNLVEESTEQTNLAKETPLVELSDGANYNIEASWVEKEIDGQTFEMLAYNGSIPGPTIKVVQGSTITVRLSNNTNVSTTLHPHGVRLDNAFDGIPDVTQAPIEPGEVYTYEIRFDDAGVFWYHPHIREDYTQDMGLYGNFIVTPKDPEEWSPVNHEEVLAIDDIYINSFMSEDQLAPYFPDEITNTLMGRYGNTMLVNGDNDYQLALKKNEVVRFFITNTANTRVFNLKIPGAKMKLVGADNGLYEHDTWMDDILLGPSERAIVELSFSEAGYYPLNHETPDKIYTLGRIIVTNDPIENDYTEDFNTLKTHQNTVDSIDPFRPYFTKAIDKNLSIDIQMKGSNGMHTMHGGMTMQNSMMTMWDGEPIEWEDTMEAMNSSSNEETLTWQLVDEDTKKSNMDIDSWHFKKGDIVKVHISNPDDTMHPMQHPIHFHGQRFLVLSVDGVEVENLVWKDTVLIPAGSEVEILVDMSNSGMWMGHCHIAEHVEDGMMFMYHVE